MEVELEMPKDIYTNSALAASIDVYKDYLSISSFLHGNHHYLKIKTIQSNECVDVEVIQSFMNYFLNKSIDEFFNEQ
jgi:hypothetical protein